MSPQRQRQFPPPQSLFLPVRGHGDTALPLHRIFCVGRNYEAHAREMGSVADRDAPFYFTKSAHHFTASGAEVPYPPGTSNFHFEMELVVVIGAPIFRVSKEEALDAVWGYACGLDLTRRDLQFESRDKGRPWDTAKDFEHSAIIADVVPAGECGHLRAGAIELRVNGDIRQQSDLSMMIHDVPAIVSHLSTLYHLHGGDVIFTGTPEGVGPLQPGDRLHGSIAGLSDVTLTIGEPA